MCQFSVYAENMRDARQGEDLTVTRAPHDASNWLTEAGEPNIAVCIPNQAPLAIEMPKSKKIRGANFEQVNQTDYLVFIDGDRERVALNSIPLGTKARVLALAWNPPSKTTDTVARMAKERQKVPMAVGSR